MSKISRKTKSIVAIILAAIMILGMSFAYFTDYATTSTSGTAGTVAVSLDSDMNLLDADGHDILNPGDMRDAGFTVTNMGNKSIDVRTTIVLTTQSNSGQSLTFSGAADTQSEYDLYLRSDVEEIPGEGWKPKADAVPLQVKAIDADTITYQPAIYSLNGNSDRYTEVETIDGINAFSQTNDYVLIFKGESGNEWQNSIVSIDVLVEAKQHENTSAGWDIVAQENVATGAINQSAVKGENVITSNSTIPTYVTVTAKDKNGQDIQMASSVVEGTEKEELLNSLDESNLVAAEDIDLIINVEASEFDGTVNATFDVSSIANPGDTVAIYHYDEAAGEWEYITTAVVDANGTVSGDFTSFSPVAFDVIEDEVDIEDPVDNTGWGWIEFLDVDGNLITDCEVQISIVTESDAHLISAYAEKDGRIWIPESDIARFEQLQNAEDSYGPASISCEFGSQYIMFFAGQTEYTVQLQPANPPVFPGDVTVTVIDNNGNPVPDAMVTLYANDLWIQAYEVNENGIAVIPGYMLDREGPFKVSVYSNELQIFEVEKAFISDLNPVSVEVILGA